MVLPLKDNTGLLKSHEERYINAYGDDVNILEYVGSSNCPVCGYDPIYKAAKNPNCTYCNGKGKVNVYTDHIEKAYALWMTEEELSKIAVGNIKIGDVKLTVRSETEGWFRNAIQHETRIVVEGNKVIPKMIFPSELRTVVHVYCSRTEID
jgi:hypothetical protein